MVLTRFSKAIFLILLAVGTLLCDLEVYAESGNPIFENLPNNLPANSSRPTQIKELIGNDTNKKNTADFVNQIVQKNSADFQSQKESWEAAEKKGVIFHAVSNNGTELKFGNQELPKISQKLNSLIAEDQEKQFKKYFDEKQYIVEGPKLTTCNENEVQFIPNKTFDPQHPLTVSVLDYLFVKPDFLKNNQLPNDYKELFGDQVSLLTCDTNTQEPDAVTIFAKSIGVTCLPYRIRVSPVGNFVLTGKEALRLFKDFSSKNKEYHPSVANNLKRVY